jgi:uncharacterized protein YuzE
MKVQYFADTDTLLIELNSRAVANTRDLNKDTVLDLDEDGQVCAITVEHASSKADVEQIIVEGMAA